jgi:hypothetical protein
MTTTDTFNQHQSATAAVPSTKKFGMIVYRTVSALSVSHAEVLARCEAENLGWAVPHISSEHDKFRSAFPNKEFAKYRKEVFIGSSIATQKLLVRTLDNAADHLDKRVVRETVDKSGKRLTYEEVWQVLYSNGSIVSLPMGTEVVQEALDLVEAQIAQYEASKAMLDSNGISRIIDKVQDRCLAANLRGRSGGMYFVLEQFADQIEALKKAVNWVPGVSLLTVDLLNPADKATITLGITDDINTQALGLAAEIAELKASKDFGVRKLGSINLAIAELANKRREYATYVDAAKLDAAGQIDVLRAMFADLQTVLPA